MVSHRSGAGALVRLLLPLLANTAYVPPGVRVDPSALRPNVLVFLIDDMGYGDLEAYGSPNVSTPQINSLIDSGMKFTHWISAAPICTPSRAAMQTGRYPVRTGCTGDGIFRILPTPSQPHGLDPNMHVSIATALKQAGYRTGMSGKWHLGINSNGPLEKQDRAFTPTAHSYDTFLGSPFTNQKFCQMDADGISQKHREGPIFCFLLGNNTVVQQPLKLVNFTDAMTRHALEFLENAKAAQGGGNRVPWYFLMSYFHVHTPLFTAERNRGRSRGGAFGDNIEEMDDSVGEIMSAIRRLGFADDTLIFLTSDNGPYQEEGWDESGRTNVYNEENGNLEGRLKGGKGQVYEGGIRMPGSVVWPSKIKPGSVSSSMVSTMDIMPTVLKAAGVDLGPDYVLDGKDMTPVLLNGGSSQHEVFLHYCGFSVLAATVRGRFKVFWGEQKWYTNDEKNASVCLECCNGYYPGSKLLGAAASTMCACGERDVTWASEGSVPVYDLRRDVFEDHALRSENWPRDLPMTYEEVIRLATEVRDATQATVHQNQDWLGAGNCTGGLPSAARQPCCPGCHQFLSLIGVCRDPKAWFKECSCDYLSTSV